MDLLKEKFLESLTLTATGPKWVADTNEFQLWVRALDNLHQAVKDGDRDDLSRDVIQQLTALEELEV